MISCYGAGTLTTVLTMVTDALSPNALPSSVVIAALPDVENVTPADAMIVPTIVRPEFTMEQLQSDRSPIGIIGTFF